MPTPPPSTQSRLLMLLVALLLVLLLVILGWLARTLLNKGTEDDLLRLQPLAPCDLRSGPCTATLDGRRLTFSIKAPALNSAHPLQFQATVDNITVQRIDLQLQGRDMYMGENHYPLVPQGTTTAAGNATRYLATGRLPVCTTGTMIWQAIIRIETDSSPLQATFEFEAR